MIDTSAGPDLSAFGAVARARAGAACRRAGNPAGTGDAPGPA
ncbi:hypothetical protein ACFVVX_18470 [Kitasatospora sp. NPDC058170]